jgi:hypothetical protein
VGRAFEAARHTRRVESEAGPPGKSVGRVEESALGLEIAARGVARRSPRALSRILEALDLPPEAINLAQEFARRPVSDGTLPPDDRAEQRKAALRLAQECGRAVAHCCLAFMELQAGGWQE